MREGFSGLEVGFRRRRTVLEEEAISPEIRMPSVRLLCLPEELVLAILSHSSPRDPRTIAASCRELSKLSEGGANGVQGTEHHIQGLEARLHPACQLGGRIWRAGHRVRERVGAQSRCRPFRC